MLNSAGCGYCGSKDHYAVQHFQLMADARNKLRSLGPASEERQHMDKSKMKICYCVTKRNGRTFWNRIGVAFLNNDGSLNVKLEAIPVNGEIQIRDYMPVDRDEPRPEDRVSDDVFDEG